MAKSVEEMSDHDDDPVTDVMGIDVEDSKCSSDGEGKSDSKKKKTDIKETEGASSKPKSDKKKARKHSHTAGDAESGRRSRKKRGKAIRIGLDVGSTTVKLVALDDNDELIFSEYMKHFSDIHETVVDIFDKAVPVLKGRRVRIMIAGSGGFNIARMLKVQFVQEVVASTTAVETFAPVTDVALELGGEDAKVTFFGEAIEQRMNGTCAGGTGAFIDQMATLMQTDAGGLNDLAKCKRQLYPIASRCGVFAKTDVQPLLNEGAAKEDIAASIFQSVVNQTIGGLCCGTPVRGNVAFLGGPLYFLSELRQRFIETLKLKPAEVIFPKDSHFFVAIGAALCAEKEKSISFDDLAERVPALSFAADGIGATAALFETNEIYDEWKERHARHRVERFPVEEFEGTCFLGIDAGSTTTKVVLIDEKGRLLYEFYDSNRGNPLKSTVEALKDLMHVIEGRPIEIGSSCVTGYGEALIQAALHVDMGEIETVAHYRAANFFLPGVDFVIDIGGQDMKCLKLRDGVIDSIMLNEACSSGCGSFVETFAKSLKMSVKDFAKAGVKSRHPVDLGSRCTVFMNSRVKQAQKEGATLEDISGGISLSIIKNALYKVIRLRNTEQLGERIVVQGGTFLNEAVLRGFETIVGREVVRPDIAGVMGAFGAALIARERFEESPVESTLVKGDRLENFHWETSLSRCKGCTNHCLLTINKFSDGGKFTSGNRCERGAGEEKKHMDLPNLYDYKNERVFDYKPTKDRDSPRGRMGIPRVLNMFDDYPFWFRFFTELGFSVILSAPSSKKLFDRGMETIPSDTVCYPAKLAHGHIDNLLKRGVRTIFYPCLMHNRREDEQCGNKYNCPIVQSYPEVIKNSMASVRAEGVRFFHPFLPIDHPQRMAKRLFEELRSLEIPAVEVQAACAKAYVELDKYQADIRQKGEEALAFLKDHPEKKGFVLAGRPYHVDPEINHGIPQMVRSFGFTVFTEDSIAHLGVCERPLRTVDQWVYHARMYRAASFVSTHPQLELIQMVSFGCGLDAVTTDQVAEILGHFDKIYTALKIDEISNLGAARIRVRSLMAAVRARDKAGVVPRRVSHPTPPTPFTKEMKNTHLLLVPQMSPIHMQFLGPVLEANGYNVEVLDEGDAEDKARAIEEGLNSVHNDACYPSLCVIGQVMAAVRSGKYDVNRIGILLSQTGGACRATNYIPFLRKALKEAGVPQIPVVSWSLNQVEQSEGFKLGSKCYFQFIITIIIGDLLMRCLLRVRPYEKVPGSANALEERWREEIIRVVTQRFAWRSYNNIVKKIVHDFDTLPLRDVSKPRVGVVGEIFLKFNPASNHEVVKFLEAEGCEAVVRDLADFFMYSSSDHFFRYEKLSGKRKDYYTFKSIVAVFDFCRRPVRKALMKSKRFEPPLSVYELQEMVEGVLSLGNQAGEGWLLTAEMIELIESGVPNIVCVQPFGCLPNHCTGKAMIGPLRRLFPLSNIAAIDYDPGASEVNQLNRLKLMLATAFRNHEKTTNKIGKRKMDRSVLCARRSVEGDSPPAEKKVKPVSQPKDKGKKKVDRDVVLHESNVGDVTVDG